jgi:hypothetical protein
MKTFHKDLIVHESHGLPYRPQTQGAIERSHGTIKNKFWAILRERGLDINELTLGAARVILQDCISTYNHEQHSTTGCIPFELFWKRTDRNFSVPISSMPVEETTFSGMQYQRLELRARTNMVKRAGISVAR